jgi:hypothetical protein
LSSGDKPSCSERRIFRKLSASSATLPLLTVSFPTAVVSIVVAAFKPSTEVKGISPLSLLSVPFPAADKVGEDKMYPSLSLCVIFPRGSNTGETGAFLLASCTGGGREVFPPTPVLLGFIPLISRVCQYTYEDIYIRQTRVCESLRSYKMSEYSISPVQVQARAYKEGYGRGIEREVDDSCSSNPSYFNWLIIFTAIPPGQMAAPAHLHLRPQYLNPYSTYGSGDLRTHWG